MTTLKPRLIRADTLDLQTQESPSAKDHTRQPSHPSPIGVGPAAPHQHQALRNAEQDALQEQMFSPGGPHHRRQSEFTDEPDFYDDQDDEAQDGVPSQDEQAAGHQADDSGIDDSDIGDQANDDGLDDDLMDKLSSSPSIEDGNYPFPILWPCRVDSIESGVAHSSLSTPLPDTPPYSSSPYVLTPEHYPISFCNGGAGMPRSHHQAKSSGHTLRNQVGSSPPSVEKMDSTHLSRFREIEAENDSSLDGLDIDDIDRHLVPLYDPFLEPEEEVNAVVTMGDDCARDSDWEDDNDTGSAEVDLSSDDDTGDFLFSDDTRFIDSGWGGECLREVEDIDFEFVYALHTFVATVEGQANATKGDTMVLLDDSNSYWWLVRVVKDGSIGYLPAEHIETPTERLARLNKHRNIDLSATMLGDNPEKSKNPLKKAMRRRNAKTVQFTAPQYYEPTDFEYSDDEEGSEGDPEQAGNGLGLDDSDPSQGEDTEINKTTALAMETERNGQVDNATQPVNSDDTPHGEKRRAPDEADPEDHAEDSVTKSKRGLVRNTDSFFKDDSLETKKISLTPRLLRGDSDINAPGQQPVLKSKGSLETFDKLVSSDADKSGDEKKKKERKGMLGGFFKRKDKKGKAQDNDSEDSKKASDELSRVTPQSKKSSESLSQDARQVKGERGPQRQSSKLQKQPPHLSPKSSPSKDNFQNLERSPHASMDSTMSPSSQDSISTPSTVRSPVAEQAKSQEMTSPRVDSPEAPQERAASPNGQGSMFSTITDALKPALIRSPKKDVEANPKSLSTKQTNHRFDVDDMESEDEATPTVGPQQARRTPPALEPPSAEEYRERLSESPVEVSPIEPPVSQQSSSASQPPTLMVDTSSNSEPRSVSPISPVSSSSSSIVDADAETPNDAEDSTNPSATSPHGDVPTPSTARSTSTWSDASLRAYMDNDDDIRDLLIIVHDKSNVVPAGPDHPITGNLFCAEKGRLAEMQSNLDSMLSNWLARKTQPTLSG